jgi:glycosyltransferase involved in cell wall biosynthesis
MRILFAGKQHYDPGGVPMSTDQLAHRLALHGHEIAVFAHAAYDQPEPAYEERCTLRREAGRRYEAYSVDLLPPGAGLGMVLRRFQPDVAVVNAGGAWWHDWTTALVNAVPSAVPLVLYVRDPEAIDLLDELAPRVDLVIANAELHAESAGRHGVTAHVVPSVIEPELYITNPTGEAVVFINPVRSKGVDTAFSLAERRPDIPFHFREAWHLPLQVARDVAERAARLGNVEFLPSTQDPTEPYRCARLLLAPYQDNGRPRVVPEAQVSGIPILARDDPAMREAVGSGGILVPPDAPLSVWLDGLDQLWSDDAIHTVYSRAATAHSQRAEIDADRIATHFVELLTTVVRSGARPRPRATADSDAPMASVIIPVRNVAGTIDAQLAALTSQTYRGSYEVIVADNGSTDATRVRVETWRDRLPSLTIVDASARRGVAHARNTGLRAAQGDVLLICDGDDVVAPDWLEHMVSALDDHPIVTGFIDIVSMNQTAQYKWTGDAGMDDAPMAYGYLPYAPGGNIGMWRDVYDTLAGFDEQLRRAEDIDFGWRASYVGIGVHFEPQAVLHHRLRSTPGSVLRGAIRGGVAEPGLYRRHRARGMPRASRSEVIGMYRWLITSMPDLLAGRRDRHQWAHHAGKSIGRLIGSARHRVVYL